MFRLPFIKLHLLQRFTDVSRCSCRFNHTCAYMGRFSCFNVDSLFQLVETVNEKQRFTAGA